MHPYKNASNHAKEPNNRFTTKNVQIVCVIKLTIMTIENILVLIFPGTYEVHISECIKS